MSEETITTVTTPAAVVAPVVVKIGLKEMATKIAEANPELVIREKTATGYVCLSPKEKADLNWRKGLIWNLNNYSAGFNFEFQLYSSKQGAHLVEFVPQFKALATDFIKAEKMGLAIRLRIKLPFALGEEAILAKCTELIKVVEPVANEVRGKLADTDFVSKKETKAKEKAAAAAVVPAAPANEETVTVPGDMAPAADAPAAEAPAPEAPATEPGYSPEVLAAMASVTPPKTVAQAAKRRNRK